MATEGVRLPSWYEKWINPTTILALLGGIVWGVQLNFAVISNTNNIGTLQSILEKKDSGYHAQNQQLARVAIILENIERRVGTLEGLVIRDNRGNM